MQPLRFMHQRVDIQGARIGEWSLHDGKDSLKLGSRIVGRGADGKYRAGRGGSSEKFAPVNETHGGRLLPLSYVNAIQQRPLGRQLICGADALVACREITLSRTPSLSCERAPFCRASFLGTVTSLARISNKLYANPPRRPAL